MAKNVSETILNMTSTMSAIETSNDQGYIQKITYGILQTCQILSFIAYFIVGYYFLSSPKDLKKTLSFHAIFIILLVNFIQLSYDLSEALQYLQAGIVKPSTYANCIIWTFIDSITYYTSLILMTWAAFERHLLIFYPNLFNTQRRRICFHYLPMVIICLYTLSYYFAVDFLYPCVNAFDFSLFICGFVCYMNLPTPNLYSIELIFHQVVPTILIGFFSIALVVRVILARQRLHQSVEWHRYRKMIKQLFSLSSVYLIFSTPFSLNPIAQAVGLPMPFSYIFYANVLTYWTYGIAITFPFIIFFSLPNISKKLKLLCTIRDPQPIQAQA
ncbi:unnamed protein product [Rotaria socialis]|uniref:G-protein coupled receptors family 1 profile domain-containing protein n=2 Tax=Rotaria socialis TaxID=392032 RepID=A0A818D182_9BILA|nr:unnamed protein product [Rotaria socialis]